MVNYQIIADIKSDYFYCSNAQHMRHVSYYSWSLMVPVETISIETKSHFVGCFDEFISTFFFHLK